MPNLLIIKIIIIIKVLRYISQYQGIFSQYQGIFLRWFYFWKKFNKIFKVAWRKPWKYDRMCLDIDTCEFKTVL